MSIHSTLNVAILDEGSLPSAFTVTNKATGPGSKSSFILVTVKIARYCQLLQRMFVRLFVLYQVTLLNLHF